MFLLFVVGLVLMNVLIVGCASPQSPFVLSQKNPSAQDKKTPFAQDENAPLDQNQNAPHGLRCEYLTNPAGIDERLPRLSWEMDDPRRGAAQRAYQVVVATSPEALEGESGVLWDTGKVASDASAQIAYAGQALQSGMQAHWRVRVWDADDQASPWSEPACWSMGLLNPAAWDASWIGDAQAPPPDLSEPLPPPRLRREFTLPTGVEIRRAVVYVTALGLYEFRLNGQRVGDHLLAPEWTDYHKRVQYQTYEVTSLLRSGANALVAQLGDGWYAGRIGLSGMISGAPLRAHYGRQPRLLARLAVELSDGRTLSVVSDGTWRVSTDGPIRASDLLDGETYDARRETPGWDRPGFDDSAWRPAGTFEKVDAAYAGPKLVAQPNEPIRIVREIRPIAMTEPQPGAYVFDLGQNMAGWSRIRLRGPAGTTVTLRHAEVLNPDGTIYTANLRSAAQTDRFTLRGGGASELFEPRFTYHGFRYVEVTGLHDTPAIEDVTGIAFCSAAPEAGRFDCSSPMLNRLMENIVWTQRANMMSVPTDCPQRDERLGWMGDILAFAQTACFNMDMAAFFTKWLPDVRDAQTDDGRYPDFAPHPYNPNTRFSGVPAWGDAGVFVPWCAYVNYGDRRLLKRHFESARRWVDYVREKNPDLLWKNSRGNDYGDWLNADTLKLEGWPTAGAEAPKEVFATMFFARSTDLVARMADVLGRRDDAQRYRALAGQIRAAFNRAYVGPDGRIQGDTQAGYAIALAFDLLPESQQALAVRHLLEGFEPYGGRISTGFHSTICLMNELTRRGHSDEAYRLINNREMPSWGYAIDHGATTVWERWDGYVEGRGFQDPGMNSFSHYAIGSVGEWMVRTIIGINPDESRPGYKHFYVRPRPGGGLTWARGTHRSLYGPIECAWRKENGRLTIDLVVPPNTTATVSVPTNDVTAVTESGHPASTAPCVQYLGMQDAAACYLVPAGRYTFSAPCPD